jgi:FAD/FMN-containing dehydrogenase
VAGGIRLADEEGTMNPAVSREAVDGLRQQFSGVVVGPDDAGYDEMRAVHNGLVDKRPALIARCANTADIADAVRFARTEGLEISTRGGGHNVAGKGVTQDDENIAWVHSTFDALKPHTADAVYVNYLAVDEPDRIRAAYGPNWDRLVTLKRRWDPDNVFHLNQNIDPSS